MKMKSAAGFWIVIGMAMALSIGVSRAELPVLASGVDVNVKLKWSGETALDVAERRAASADKPDRCVVEALLARGAKHGEPPATEPADE